MNSCDCSCGCQSKSQENTDESPANHIVDKQECPVCNTISKAVPTDVVFTFANKELKENVGSKSYYLCTDPDCEVAYFNKNKDVITVNDIRRPIWFKKGANPKIICYCNNITEKQIKEAVRQDDLKSWSDIVLYYRKKKICACNKLNPTGECCTGTFYKVINETLDELGKERVNVSNQCCG